MSEDNVVSLDEHRQFVKNEHAKVWLHEDAYLPTEMVDIFYDALEARLAQVDNPEGHAITAGLKLRSAFNNSTQELFFEVFCLGHRLRFMDLIVRPLSRGQREMVMNYPRLAKTEETQKQILLDQWLYDAASTDQIVNPFTIVPLKIFEHLLHPNSQFDFLDYRILPNQDLHVMCHSREWRYEFLFNYTAMVTSSNRD